MPNFQPDLTQVAAGIEILPKDIYEFIVGEPKAFIRDKSDGSGQSYGVRYPLIVAEGPKRGSKQFFNCMMGSDGGMSFAKQFLMACLGYTRKEEAKFNAEFAGKDWGFDTDTGAVGDVWRAANSCHFMASLDVGIRKDTGEEQQKWVSMSPVGK